MNRPTARCYIPPRYGTLKEACAVLVTQAGGLEAAAEKCRIGKSALSDQTNPHKERAYPAVDVVLALERAARARPVTEYLALQHNCLLMELPAGAVDPEWARDIAEAAKDVSDVFAAMAAALADNRIDRGEATTCLREVDEALATLMRIRAHLVAVSTDAAGLRVVGRG